jgi:hypothetical protein
LNNCKHWTSLEERTGKPVSAGPSMLYDVTEPVHVQHARQIVQQESGCHAVKSITLSDKRKGYRHKVLTYVEYRAVSGVFQNINPPPPLHPPSVSSPRTKGRGYTPLTRRAVGRWGVNILEDASQTLDWPLTV